MKIALIEDDPIQRKPICSWLEQSGYQCDCYERSFSFIEASEKHNSYDLMLLDWELPDRSGLELLRWIRSHHGHTLPVMFLTRRGEEMDIVTALKAGADDYLVKPAREQELLARIEAVARRNIRGQGRNASYTIGPFELDTHSRQLHRDGQPLNLTQKEFSLAQYLLGNLGQLVTRQELLENVWKQSASLNTRTVDTHISRLRRKLELVPEQGWHLTAVYQYGYRLDWMGEGCGA